MRCTSLLRSASSPAAARAPPPPASRYSYFLPYATKWSDNDVYGHLNNSEYTRYFDSAINSYLINKVHMPLPYHPTNHPPSHPSSRTTALPIGLAVHSATTFSASLEYPQPIVCAVGVREIGRSSVTWEAALFAGEYVGKKGGREDDGGCWLPSSSSSVEGAGAGELVLGKQVRIVGGREARAAAHGTFKHVFVGRESRRSEEIPEGMRKVVERLLLRD